MRNADVVGAGVRRFRLVRRAVGGARAGVLVGPCVGRAVGVNPEPEPVPLPEPEGPGPKVLPLRWCVFGRTGCTMGWREEKDVEEASLGLANSLLGASPSGPAQVYMMNSDQNEPLCVSS